VGLAPGTAKIVRVPAVDVYDAFGIGRVCNADGPLAARFDPVGFGGQFGYYHDYQGRYLLGHRYFDAYTGRFVTRDPIGYKGGINLYGFAGNNPVNRSDPNGTSDSDSFNPFAYFNNLFSYATPHDVLHAIKHNDVVHAVSVFVQGLSYIPLPENPGFDAKAATVAVEAGAPIARAATREIALRLDPYYKKLAAETGAAPWREWVGRIVNAPTSPRFGRLFNQAAKRATHIHFSLDGLGDVQQEVRKGAAGFIKHNFTNAELHNIMTNPALRAKTTFYRGGKIVTP